jgi:hypothetical protein
LKWLSQFKATSLLIMINVDFDRKVDTLDLCRKSQVQSDYIAIDPVQKDNLALAIVEQRASRERY